MPGKFIDEVHIYKCGTHSDGTAIMCSEILKDVKVPFHLSEDVSESGEMSEDDIAAVGLGWQEKGSTDVHLSLPGLVKALEPYGITVSYDEEDLARLLAAKSSDGLRPPGQRDRARCPDSA